MSNVLFAFRFVALIVAAVFVYSLLSVSQAAGDVPAAESGQECMLFADMALTARAAAMEGVTKTQMAGMVERIYRTESGPLVHDDRLARIAAILLSAAYKDKREPVEFATQFGQSCIEHRGDLAPFFGLPV